MFATWYPGQDPHALCSMAERPWTGVLFSAASPPYTLPQASQNGRGRPGTESEVLKGAEASPVLTCPLLVVVRTAGLGRPGVIQEPGHPNHEGWGGKVRGQRPAELLPSVRTPSAGVSWAARAGGRMLALWDRWRLALSSGHVFVGGALCVRAHPCRFRVLSPLCVTVTRALRTWAREGCGLSLPHSR